MSAYVVVEVEVKEPVPYERYKLMAPPAIGHYGGRYVARGTECVQLEGTWNPRRLVILEFPSKETALAWWNSPEYAEAKKLRQATATTQMVLIDGVVPGSIPGAS